MLWVNPRPPEVTWTSYLYQGAIIPRMHRPYGLIIGASFGER